MSDFSNERPVDWNEARRVAALLSDGDESIGRWIDLAESNPEQFYEDAERKAPELAESNASSPESVAQAFLRFCAYVTYLDWKFPVHECVGLYAVQLRMRGLQDMSDAETAKLLATSEDAWNFPDVAVALDEHARTRSMRLLCCDAAADGYAFAVVSESVFEEFVGTSFGDAIPRFFAATWYAEHERQFEQRTRQTVIKNLEPPASGRRSWWRRGKS